MAKLNEYRIKLVRPERYQPQVKTWIGWRSFYYYPGYDGDKEAQEFTTEEDAREFIRKYDREDVKERWERIVYPKFIKYP